MAVRAELPVTESSQLDSAGTQLEGNGLKTWSSFLYRAGTKPPELVAPGC